MKYIIFGDIHGKSLGPLECAIQSHIDESEKLGDYSGVSLICLGDFDDTEPMHEVVQMVNNHGGIIVPGNHDYMLFNKYVDLVSGTFGPGRNAFMYAVKIDDDKKASQFLKRLLYSGNEPNSKSLIESQTKTIKLYKEKPRFSLDDTVIVHGGLAGDLNGKLKELGAETDKMWFRLYDENGALADQYAEDNFKKMERMGCRIMIRGHDHIQSYVSKLENGDIEIESKQNTPFTLDKKKMHIINPGAYFDGLYAVIDTSSDVPVLTFRGGLE